MKKPTHLDEDTGKFVTKFTPEIKKDIEKWNESGLSRDKIRALVEVKHDISYPTALKYVKEVLD